MATKKTELNTTTATPKAFTINPDQMHYIHIEDGVHHVFLVDESDHTTKHAFDCSQEELPEHLQKGLAFLKLLPDESEGDKIGARLAADFFLVL